MVCCYVSHNSYVCFGYFMFGIWDFDDDDDDGGGVSDALTQYTHIANVIWESCDVFISVLFADCCDYMCWWNEYVRRQIAWLCSGHKVFAVVYSPSFSHFLFGRLSLFLNSVILTTCVVATIGSNAGFGPLLWLYWMCIQRVERSEKKTTNATRILDMCVALSLSTIYFTYTSKKSNYFCSIDSSNV